MPKSCQPKKIAMPVTAVAAALLGIYGLVWPSAADAGGFALNEMSAGSVGNAHAGAGAAAEDLGTLYYNPAGLARFSGKQFMVVGSAIRPTAKFTNQGSLSAVGTPMSGGNGGDAGSWALVPALYGAMDLTPALRFGVGVQAPFGLKTDYDANWVGRYQALKSELKNIDINPTLSYRINEKVSVGAGVSAQYVDVELSRAIDFGSVCIGTFGAGACAPIGFLPQAQDGKATVKGDDWGYGYNFGVLLAPTSNTRVGLAYRSKVTHKISGDATYDKPAGLPAALAASSTFSNTSARANLTLPESASVSGYIDLDAKWALMGDVSWTRWSRFRELRVSFDNGAADSVTVENWRNTVRVAAAVNYRYNDQWKMRAGLAYDQSPVRDAFRTPRVPDTDRTWLALGAQFKASPQATWDVGYAHLFVKNSTINKAEPPVGGTLIGGYKNDVNIFSVQYGHTF